MRVEIEVFRIALLIEQQHRGINLIGCFVFRPIAVIVGYRRVGRILTRCRVEQHLCIEDVMVLERRTEYAEVARKLVVKRFLRNVYLCHEHSVVFVSDDGVMIHHSERSSVV